MFSHIYGVFRYELVRNFFRRAFLLTTFGLPLLGVTIFLVTQVVSSSGDTDDESVQLEFELESIQTAGYVDQSGFFTAPGELAADVMIPFESQDAAEDALDAGEIDVYYVIPDDYLERGDIILYLPNFSLTMITDGPVQQLYFSQLMEQGVSEETLIRLLNPAQIETEVLQTDTDEAAVTDELDSNRETVVVVFAVILLFSLFSTSTYLMQTVIEEKESYIIEILISSVSPVELLAGKIFALGTLGLFQVVIYVGTFVGVAAFATDLTGPFADISIPLDLLAVAVVYYILGYLLFAALFGMVGAVSASLTEGPSLSTIFLIPAMLPWIFWALYTEDPQNPIVTILSFVPLTSPLGMVMRSAVTDVSLIEYVISVVLLIITVAFVMWMAGRLFRVQTLLAGKFPKLRQIPKLIFGNG